MNLAFISLMKVVDEQRHNKTCHGFSTRSHTKQAVQARSLKFWNLGRAEIVLSVAKTKAQTS